MVRKNIKTRFATWIKLAEKFFMKSCPPLYVLDLIVKCNPTPFNKHISHENFTKKERAFLGLEFDD